MHAIIGAPDDQLFEPSPELVKLLSERKFRSPFDVEDSELYE